MKVAIYGAGGVGAYFGARLAQAGADVHLIEVPAIDALYAILWSWAKRNAATAP